MQVEEATQFVCSSCSEWQEAVSDECVYKDDVPSSLNSDTMLITSNWSDQCYKK